MTNFLSDDVETQRPIRTAAMGAFLSAAASRLVRSTIDSRTSTVAGVNSHVSETGPSYIFVPGCSQDMEYLEPIYERHLGHLGSRHYVFQRSGRYSREATNDAIMQACERDGERDRVLLLTSMGLMEGMQCLARPETRAALGKNCLKAIVAKSGLTSREDLMPQMKKALNISAIVPPLPVVGAMYSKYRMRRLDRDIPHSDSVSDEEAKGHYASSAKMPFRLVSSQHRMIKNTEPLAPGALASVVDENPDIELHQITADYDHVVDRYSVRKHMHEAFGRAVMLTIDFARPYANHADDVEYIKPVVDIASRYSNVLTC